VRNKNTEIIEAVRRRVGLIILEQDYRIFVIDRIKSPVASRKNPLEIAFVASFKNPLQM
jgi:hypothetical protein